MNYTLCYRCSCCSCCGSGCSCRQCSCRASSSYPWCWRSFSPGRSWSHQVDQARIWNSLLLTYQHLSLYFPRQLLTCWSVVFQLRVPQADSDDGSGDVALSVQVQVQELLSNDHGMAFILCAKYFSFFNELFILSHTVYFSFSGIFLWKACLWL